MQIEQLVKNLERFTDWQERYRYIIALGRKLPALQDDLKTQENKVEGCVSQVWVVVDRVDDNDTMFFNADSDSAIVKGLITIVLALYSGKTPKEIISADVDSVFQRVGLDRHLSPNRRNGFYSMVMHIKKLAVAQAMQS